MDLGFKGKVALVTGAGSQVGFGKETALLLVKEGCDTVAVTDVNLEDVEKTAEAIKKLGGNSIAIKADITNHAEVDAMVRKVLNEYGKIDILCNVAGGIIHKDNVAIDEQDPEVWEKQLKLNLVGTMNVSRAVVPAMRASTSALAAPTSTPWASGHMPCPSTLSTCSQSNLPSWKEKLASG